MPSNIVLPELYRYTVHNKNIMANIIIPGLLSETKIYFSDTYDLLIPNVIEIDLEGSCQKRTIIPYKDFKNNQYISFKKLSFESENTLILPLFSGCEFLCLKCKKLYKPRTEKCCSLDSGIQIYKGKLSKIYIPKIIDNTKAIKHVRDEFVDLHYSDLLDTILLK